MLLRRRHVLVSLFLCACGAPRVPATGRLRPDDFLIVKRWILTRGDRETFSQMYNRNPHYAFGGVDAFLIPDIGQQNIDCDPRRSDFDAVVLRVAEPTGQHYVTLRLVDRELRVEPGGDGAIVDAHWARIVKIAQE